MRGRPEPRHGWNRRKLLGAGLAAVSLPTLAFGQAASDANRKAQGAMRIRMTFDGRTLTATLHDNPSARDFYAMLPLDLTIEDFASSEKIAYLPRKLTEEGRGRFDNERPYDICYYAPWGNLALFYVDYSYARDLIRLGRIEEGQDALHIQGEFPLRIEAL